MKQSLGPKTLLYPTPVLVIGSYGEQSQPNIMTVSWGGICCSEPPCIAISVRPSRQTHANIVRAKAFTVNIPSAAQARAADYAGIYSGRDEDKFAALGLTPVRSELVDAPYIEEFPLVLECRLVHTLDLGTHVQFIGQVLDAKADPAILAGNSFDLAKLDPFSFAPGEGGYHRLGERIGSAFNLGRKA